LANDRIGIIEERIETHSHERDKEFADLATVVARNSEVLNSCTVELGRIREELNRVREAQPGPLQLWGPVLLTVSVVAGAFTFVMAQAIKPLEHDIESINSTIERQRDVDVTISNRQRENEAFIQYNRGRLDALREQVSSIDQLGTRELTRYKVEGEK
jgi:hypothetical protein